MNSITIEVLRFGAEQRILSKGEKYLTISGPHEPVQTFEINLGYEEFLRLYHAIRYPGDVAGIGEQEALDRLSAEVSHVLAIPEKVDNSLHIDLVINASELWPLPFEAIPGSSGIPLLIDQNAQIVLTRRLRNETLDQFEVWPVRPRVLFVSSSPDYIQAPRVPVDDHLEVLRAALKPWIEPIAEIRDVLIPDERPVLSVLRNASVGDIMEVMQKAQNEGHAFTHVHILAHGMVIKDPVSPLFSRYGVALESESGKAVEADELVKALCSVDRLPVAVTLAICDGGNESNTIISNRGIALSLHKAGVPVVIASQLPLTFRGSVILAKEFYRQLFSGIDVRNVLHHARVKLAGEPEARNDWLGMVSYVQLPAHYSGYLDAVRLERNLASLQSARQWFRHMTTHRLQSNDAFASIVTKIKERIKDLTDFLDNTSKEDRQKGLYEENSGLLGSANKRLAEVYFYWSVFDIDQQNSLLEKCTVALREAHTSYKMGHDYNLSHHWTGIQHLSLETVLTGKIEHESYWHTVWLAAKNNMEDVKDFWAPGTLVELYLLAPYAGQSLNMDEARYMLDEFALRAGNSQKNRFALKSMTDQLSRYVEWWTKSKGYFSGAKSDCSESASILLNHLHET
jgi:hypothetical protein